MVSWKNKYLGSLIGIFLIPLTALATDPSLEDEKDNKEAKAIEVFAEKVEESDIFDAKVFGGFLESSQALQVAPEVGGLIESVSVQLGQQVRKGQKIAQIKPTGTGLTYQSHAVRSPMNGLITELFHRAGDRIEAGTILATIENPSSLETTIYAPGPDLSEINAKSAVDVVSGYGTDQVETVAATVTSISPRADPQTATFPVKLSLACGRGHGESCPTSFRLGSFVRVVIKTNRRKGVKIPLAYLFGLNQQVIAIDDQGKAKWLNVELGRHYGEDVEVVSGLKPGTTIVTSFAESPSENQPVKIVPDESTAISLKDKKNGERKS